MPSEDLGFVSVLGLIAFQGFEMVHVNRCYSNGVTVLNFPSPTIEVQPVDYAGITSVSILTTEFLVFFKYDT